MKKARSENSAAPRVPDFTPLQECVRRNGYFATGFTIIEIVMVIVIVGILAAVAIPRFESFYFIKLNGAFKKVISDIRYVQQIAVSRHSNTRLVFDVAADTYSAQEETSAGSGVWVSIKDPFTRADLQANFNTDYQYNGIDIASIDFGASGSILQFDWHGAPVNGGTINLSFRGNSKVITVEANTGFCR